MKNVKEISEDLMELKPTFFAGVPKVFDRVYEGMYLIILCLLCKVTNVLLLIVCLSGIQKAIEDLIPRRRKIFHLLYK